MVEKMNYKIINKINDKGEIQFYGEVVEEQPIDWWTGQPIEGMFISLDGFLKDLEQLKNKTEITVRINSCGGDFNTGVVIHNLLKDLPARKIGVIDGLAASAASIIACACDELKVFPSSRLMIHKAQAGLCGYFDEEKLNQAYNRLKTCKSSMIPIYQAKCKKSEKEIEDIINAETWYVGQEIIDNGFAETLIDAEKDVNLKIDNNGKFVIANGIKHDISNFKNFSKENISEETMIEKIKNKVLNAINDNKKEIVKEESVQNQEREEKIMCKTVEELRTAYPELVAQVEKEAVENSTKDVLMNERKRISEIEEIQDTINDAEMVKNAKFGENPMQAQELALFALKKQKELASAYLDNVASDNADAKVNDIVAEGSKPEEDIAKTDDDKTNAFDSMKAAMKRVQNVK